MFLLSAFFFPKLQSVKILNHKYLFLILFFKNFLIFLYLYGKHKSAIDAFIKYEAT